MRTPSQKILTLFFLVCVSVSLMGSGVQLKGFDLKKKFGSAGDTALVNKYARIALRYKDKKVDPKYIKANIDTAELICKKENIELTSLLHLARAQYFYNTGDFNNSSQEATIALKLSKNEGDTKTIIRTMIFLGQYNLRTGFFQESIEYFKNSISLAEKEHLKGYKPLGYNLIAGVFSAMGNTREYNIYLKKLIDAGHEENDTSYIKLGYYLLGSSYTGENRNYRKADTLVSQDYKVPDSLVFRNFKKADSLLRISLSIAQKKKDTIFIIRSLANLGWNFYREKKYDSAVVEYNKTLKYSIQGKVHEFIANAYGNLGTTYRDMGKTDISLKYYSKSIEEAKLYKDVFSLYWVYLDMSDMYLQKRDTTKAFNNYVLYKKYSDLYLKMSKSQGLAEAKIKYDADAHKKELQLLSLKLSNQRLLIYGYTGLFILSLAIGILLFSRARINNKRRISEMNHKISEITQANLRQQMNPHFIFNTLNSIQYYMYQHDKLATNNYLTKFSSLMRKVLENSQHTAIPLRDELEALNLYLELEMIRFKDRFDYEIKVDDEIDPLLYKVPTMLIQPYVENSISHGLMPCEGKGLVKIGLKLENEYISCTIEDNGIGREAAQEIKRKKEGNHNSLGTQIVASRLDLVNAMYGTSLKTIYTDLKNIKGEPEGTRVEIQIPILT
jgi:tetratricopeptide (TPR) repeat protein